jgi:hypothetical protein
LTSYAKGSTGLHQYDGTSWIERPISGAAMRPNTLFFNDKDNGWLVDGNGKIFNYKDSAWTKVFDGNTVQLNAVQFANSTYGWVAGNKGVIFTNVLAPAQTKEEIAFTKPDNDGKVKLTWPLAADSLKVVKYSIFLDSVFVAYSASNSFELNLNQGTLKSTPADRIVNIKGLDASNIVKVVYEPVKISTSTNVSDTTSAPVVNPVGISSTLNKEISLFPNPSEGIVNVKASIIIKEIVLTNLNGQVVFKTQPNTKETQLKLKNLKGIYFTKVLTSDGVTTGRILIK